MGLDGAINNAWFKAYVAYVLASKLLLADVVNMDNLSSHKRASLRERIEAAVATFCFVQPYSPDFNPIEKSLC